MNILRKSALVAATVLSTAFAMQAHAQMFENARRSDPAPGDGKGVLQMIVHRDSKTFVCTAFFVNNKGNKPYIMSARHCAGYEMTKVCNEGGITFKTHAGSFTGKCQSVAIEKTDLDETLLVGNFENWETKVLPNISFYTLSDQRPRFDTRLEMLGYPADPVRRGAFTITDQCWVSGERMVNIYDYPQQAAAMKTKFTAIASNNLFSLLKHRMPAFHNCSVYGGNSGGPILKEGTSIVLGLPTSFFPDASKLQPQTLSTSMDATADFVAENRKALKRFGIQFAQPYPREGYVPPYLVRQDAWGRTTCYQTTQLNSPNAQPAAMSYCEQ